jgi:hypothetical protein
MNSLLPILPETIANLLLPRDRDIPGNSDVVGRGGVPLPVRFPYLKLTSIPGD